MAEWEQMLDDLVTSRHHALVAYARMLTGHLSDAEDLVQEALIVTFGRRRRLSNLAAAEAYTRRAIATKFIDGTRRRAAENRAFYKVGASDVDPGPSPEFLAQQSADVQVALATLSPRERACVVLRYLDHQTIKETASALGLSEGSVKRYVHDAVVKLNAHLGTSADPSVSEWVSVESRRP